MAQLETILNIKVEGTSDMVKFKDEINNTEKELKDLKKAQKDAGTEGQKFTKDIVEQETKLKALRKGLNQQKTDLLKTTDAVKATGKSYNDLTKQNAALASALRKLQDPLGKDQKEFQKLSGQINKNTTSLKKMDSAMGRSQRNVGNYGGAVKGMALQIGAAVMAFKTLERVVGVFVDFEFQIKQVGVISGATAEEMKGLEKQAKDLGATTAFTAGEVAGLQKELAKLGFDPTEIQNMTDSVLDLSFAFGEDLGSTATIVGATLRQFNLDSEETSRVTDVMATAFANSSLDLGKFENAMAKVAPVANAMGFTLEDTTAILGTLTNAGIDASTAGTSLRNIFLKMSDPTGDLAVALGRNVTSVDELIPAMNELTAKGIDVAGMLEITDKRSVTAFASMLKGSVSIDKLNDKLLNAEGTTKQFADVMRDSLKGSIDEMTSAASAFAMELIEQLAPIIESLLDLFSGMFGILRKLAPVMIAATSAFIGYKVAVIASSVATTIWNTATTAMRIISIATSGGVRGLTRAMKLLNIAIKANPVGLLVGALTGAVALFATMSDETEESSENLEKLNKETERMQEVQKGLEQTQTNELANVKQLIATIKDENVERGKRAKAVEDLNKIAGTNITNLDNEKKLTEELAGAYKKAVDNIKAKYILDLAKEEVLGLVAQEVDLMNQLEKAQERENKALEEYNQHKSDNAAIAEADRQALSGAVQMIDAEGNAIAANINIKKRNDVRTESNAMHEEHYNEVKKEREILDQKILDLQEKQNTKMSKAQGIVEGLVVSSGNLNDKKKDERTEYQKLQDNVSQYTKDLKEAITTQGDVVGATANLKKAKKELMVVDDQVKKVNDELAESLNPVLDADKKRIESLNKTITAENKKLSSITKLKDAGAELAKEQIEQSLKVAKAQLDLALITIKASDDSTETQVNNINTLKATIEGYEKDLKNMGSNDSENTGGWLQSTLFGKKEDGTDFTGEELIESIAMTIGQVSQIMSSVNQMQQEQLNTEVQGIEGAKETELKAIRETQEYKIASSEDQAKMEEAITKKHDKKILELKLAQFDRDKKMMKAQALMQGAMAIMSIWSGVITGNPLADAIIKGVLTAAQVAMTGIQIATINAQAPPTAELGGIMDNSFFEEGGQVKEKFAIGGMVQGRSHADGGEKFAVGGKVVELEGGEAVINKKSTAMFKPMLSAMNVAGGGRKFADGGLTMATDMMETQSLAMSNAIQNRTDQKVFLVEADVTDTQLAVSNIEAQATF